MKLLKHYCTVQELAAISPMCRAEIGGGWAGRRKIIAKVVSVDLNIEKMANKDFEDLEESMLLIKIPAESDFESKKEQLIYFMSKLLNLSLVSCVLVVGGRNNCPSYLRELADKQQIPLLFYENTKKNILGNILEEQLQEALDFAQVLIAKNALQNFAQKRPEYDTAIFQTDLGLLLDKLRKYLLNPVILLNPLFKQIPEGNIEKEDITELSKLVFYAEKKHNSKYIRDTMHEGKIFHKTKGEIKYYICPLVYENENFGFILALDSAEHLNELDRYYLKETAALSLRVLLDRRRVQEIEEKYKDQFLYDLLYNNFETEEIIIKKAQQWQWDFTGQYKLFVLNLDTQSKNIPKYDLLKQIRVITTDWLKNYFSQVITTEQYNQLVFIVTRPQKSEQSFNSNQYWKIIMTDLQKYLSEELPTVSFSIGLGRFYSNILDICRSYQEAKQALELGRFVKPKGNISSFEELGIMRLLAHVSREELDDFYKEHMNAIIDYDEENNSNFSEILQTYFQQNMNLNLTAEQLFMHPNTLRYRLKKIEELLEVDMQNWDTKLNLAIVCKIGGILRASR